MSSKSRVLNVRSSPTFAICTVTIAIFVDLFLYGLIIPILPQILETQAGIAPADVQLNLSGLLAAYNAAVVVCAPISGYLADEWTNRKLPLIGGLFALGGATVLFMLSKTVALLYIARVLQGASAAIVWAVGLALLVDAVGAQGIGAAMGWTSLGLSLGNTVGPLLGGVVYQHAGRYATFSVAFGAIAVDVLFRLLLVEPKKNNQLSVTTSGRSEAFPGPAIELGSLQERSCEADGSPNVRVSSGASPQPNTRYTQRMPAIIKILQHRAMLSGLWSVFLATVVLTGLEAVIPLHVERIFGWNSQGAGLIFLAIVLPIFLSPVIGILYDRHGPNLLSATGFALVVVAGPLLAVVRLHSIGLIVCLVFLLILVGLGVSLVMTPQMAEVGIFAEKKAEADPSLFGTKGATAQCCALMTIATALAGVVGPVITGAVQSSSGWTATSVTVGSFAAAGCASLIVSAWYRKHTVTAQTITTEETP